MCVIFNYYKNELNMIIKIRVKSMDENSIRVTNAIIHILDTNMDMPVLSNTFWD